MDEMIQMAKALKHKKSFKDRQERLIESLDNLSFNYPDVYIQLGREFKKRELESNDINKINKWQKTSNSHTKLHEALILVKNHNVMAKEKYLENLKHMLCQTIDSGNDIDAALKICSLIEKSNHLASIHESLKHLIQRVKQLHLNKPNRRESWTSNLEKYSYRSFHSFNIPPAIHPPQPQQQTQFWPTIFNPTSINTPYDLPHFNLQCYGYDNFQLIATTNKCSTFDFKQTVSNLTIVGQDMDGAVYKWLHYLKLHKYFWFFEELSYLEIEIIDEDNIEGFITKVDKDAITKGAQKKICISTKTLKDRPQKLKDILMALDLEVTPNELCEFIKYMRDILHYPIPNKNCIVGDQIQEDIVIVMEKCLHHLLEKLNVTKTLISQSLLGTSINKFMECTMLITSNQIFMKNQFDRTQVLVETLKYKVNHMSRNFN